MKHIVTGDRIVLGLLVLIVCLFGAVVYSIDDHFSDNPTNGGQEGQHQYSIKIEQEKPFWAILESDPTAFFTKWLFIATAVLAVFTFGLATVTVLIWKDTKEIAAKQNIASRRALIHAAKSAKASEQAVEEANKSSEMQLRAYINVFNVVISQSPDIPSLGRASILFKNFGQTPAHLVKSSHVSDYIVVPLTETEIPVFTKNASVKGNSPFSCAPTMGGETTFVFSSFHTKASSLEEGKVVQRRLFVRGEIIYFDVFAKERTTNFCFYFVDDNVSGPRFIPWSVGNTAT